MFELIKETLHAVFLQQYPSVDMHALSKQHNVTLPPQVELGDMSSNIAMASARLIGKSPRVVAESLVEGLLATGYVESVRIEGAGFLNLFLKAKFVHEHAAGLLGKTSLKDYVDFSIPKTKSINIEFVSANPTGPLHLGNFRGAFYGQALADFFKTLGVQVTTEYYVNDSGNQLLILAYSVWLRYQVYCNDSSDTAEWGVTTVYPGEYIESIAKEVYSTHGNSLLSKPLEEKMAILSRMGVAFNMQLIQQDLTTMGIQHDKFVYETQVIAKGTFKVIFERLKAAGLIYWGTLEKPKDSAVHEDYEERMQWIFKSTALGDDLDRGLMRANGEPSYFANDIANHYLKTETANHLIVVLGHDHVGYAKRIQVALKALNPEVIFDIPLTQMVNLFKEGKPFRLSKRAGTTVSIAEATEEVGLEALKFFMLYKKNDTPIDIEINTLKDQSKDNFLFYIQYAHARICSVLRQSGVSYEAIERHARSPKAFSTVESKSSLRILLSLFQLSSEVKKVYSHYEIHRLLAYSHQLASQFHSLYAAGKSNDSAKFIQPNNSLATLDNLLLLMIIKQQIISCFSILNIEVMETM